MNQYFEYDAQQKSDPKRFAYYFGDREFVFESDAGLFSTGHVDAATELLLQHIEPFSGSLLDMGCGWGPVGIILGKIFGLSSVTLADINPKALHYAKINCGANGLTADCILSDCYQNIEGSFDVIAVNPPIHAGKAVVFAIYEGARTHLSAGGKLYVVIHKKHGAESSITKLREVFGHCELLYKKKGVFVLRCENHG